MVTPLSDCTLLASLLPRHSDVLDALAWCYHCFFAYVCAADRDAVEVGVRADDVCISAAVLIFAVVVDARGGWVVAGVWWR